jgi:3-methyladenine DNA glycosylase AlkC
VDPNKTHAEIGELAQRSPALRQREIPADVLDALSRGWIESKNLVEWLSVDRRILLGVLSVELNIDLSATLRALIEDREPLSPLQLSKRIAIELATIISPNDERFKSLEQHKSDVVREWGALIVGHWESMTFARRLAWIKPFAINPNPGTREIAWMALRAYVAQDPENAISKLIPWTGSRNDRMRRYASEITRPCGVWCTHIDRLKKEPHLGIEVLEPLRSDESLYVRNSVANWLNDASKYSPDWVLDITHRWARESPTEQTKYIVKRALRTLRKTNR